MCGRTSLFALPEVIEDRFEVSVFDDIPPRYNVGPGDWLATVTNTHPDRVTRLTWGLVPHWSDDPGSGPRPINARRETLDEAAPFRSAYRDRRCLVIVDGFYEWTDGPDGRQPIRFERTDRAPFALAGVWDRWSNNGDALETVSIVTTDAVPAIEQIHDRMPVILGRDAERGWLEHAPDDPATSDVLDPVYDEDFHQYTVDPRMNTTEVDDEAVIDYFDTGGQRTLEEY